MDTTTKTTMSTDKSHWRESKAVVWFCKGVQFIAAQWLLIGFAVACVLGRFFPCEFLSLFFTFIYHQIPNGVCCDLTEKWKKTSGTA